MSVPEIDEPPRDGLVLNQPVFVSVLDARADRADSQAVTGAIYEGIKRAYGASVESLGYYAQVPGGRVAVRVRLMANGADFGSRVVSATAISNSFATARASAPGSLVPVVTVASEQSSIASVLETEGWWIGTSWLELEIQDNRSGSVQSFALPIVAEERESNTLGYRSAGRASEKAWGRASQQLFRVLDSLLIALRDDGA